MNNYFLKTRHVRVVKRKTLFGIKYGSSFYDLCTLSLKIKSDDEREFYEIDRDFDIKASWKDLLFRQEVLFPLFTELRSRYGNDGSWYIGDTRQNLMLNDFTLESISFLIKRYGISKERMKVELIKFLYPLGDWKQLHEGSFIENNLLIIGIGIYAKEEELLEYSIPQLEVTLFSENPSITMSYLLKVFEYKFPNKFPKTMYEIHS